MKKYIYSILLLTLFAFASCNDELNNKLNNSNNVRISFKTTSTITTRGTIEDTSLEERVDWVDVFIFNADKTIYHKERVDISNAPIYKNGEFSIQKGRDEFAQNTPYYVYLVANASQSLTTSEAGVNNWSDLQALVQFDNNIHLSAFIDTDGNPAFADAPARFLMDGFAYVGNAAAPNAQSPTEMGTCIINDPNVDEILLRSTIYRAAAKFVINIKQGKNVEFKKALVNPGDNTTKTPQYYINQLPVSTKVLPQTADDQYKPATQNTATVALNDYTFVWNNADNSMTIIGYGYADDWSKLEYAKQSSILFNIPMMWDKDKDPANGKEETSSDNWYKISLSKSKSFKRNTCYTINININAVGAKEKDYAIELKNIEYITQPWKDVNVNFGGYNAAFLTLNKEVVKIYNTNIDTDQLSFTSSSPIKSIRLKDTFTYKEQTDSLVQCEQEIDEKGNPTGNYKNTDGVYAYYIDKFGQKVQLGTDPGFDIKDIDHPEWTKEDILTKEANLYRKEDVADNQQYIRAEVWDEHKRALNGNITIHSPILAVEGNDDLDWNSHFNTVRYLEFEVENEQGITATFRVEQTPVTVISNIEGFFSYRSDFHVGNDSVYHSKDSLDFVSILNYGTSANVGPTEFTYDNMYNWKNPPTTKSPIHYLHPASPFYVISGFLPYHEHETDQDGNIKTSCSNYVGYEELLYGLMLRNYHRAFGPGKGSFHRRRNFKTDGSLLVSNRWVSKNSKWQSNASNYYNAIGPVYEKVVNGETKYYRRHYTGNFFETFWSKYVKKVYTENGVNDYNRPRLKGQADIVKQGPGDDWNSWDVYTTPRFYVNHRMYHVRVTSTSNDFIISNPQLMDENGKPTNDRERGFTMEGEINSRVVSPSFMVASQLGESMLPKNEHQYVIPGVEGIYYYAKRQCQEYVETRYEDTKEPYGEYTPGEPVYHYDDWRLPTAAEIEYIISQQESSRAMDKVLYAQYYYHASKIKGQYDESTLISKEVPNWVYLPDLYPEEDWKEDQSYKGWYMRCVRDAYIEPEPVYYDENYNVVKVGK